MWNLGFGLPYLFRPDEDVMVGRAVHMAAEGSLDPLFYIYPPLVFDLFGALKGPVDEIAYTAHVAGLLLGVGLGIALTVLGAVRMDQGERSLLQAFLGEPAEPPRPRRKRRRPRPAVAEEEE